MSERLDPQEALNAAIQGIVDGPGELVTHWVLTAEVARPDGGRHLIHRAGGGHDGYSAPTVWQVAGMNQAHGIMVTQQLAQGIVDPPSGPDVD